METDINDSKCAIIEVKYEPIEYSTVYPKSGSCYGLNAEIDCKKAKWAVNIKEEVCENASSPIIAHNNIKIKLNLSDDDLSNSSGKQEPDDASETVVQIMDTKHVDRKDVLKYMTISDNEWYKCKICRKRFRSRKVALKHIKLHIDDKRRNIHNERKEGRSYKCKICDESFTTNHYMMQHILGHIKTQAEEKNFKCDACDKRFETKHYMLVHSKTHIRERNYKCEICDKTFLTKQSLSSHSATHKGQKKFKCEICNKRFTTEYYMLKHVKAHTEEGNHVKPHIKDTNYNCEICTRYFVSKRRLVNHVKMHTGEMNFFCNICSKGFLTKPNMLMHMKIHEKSFVCKICKKCVPTEPDLSQHMRAHAGEQNCKCAICNERFETSEAFLRHMKTHLEESNEDELILFQCDIRTSTSDEVSKIDKPLSKEEIGAFEKMYLMESCNEAMEQKPSTPSNQNCVGTAVVDDPNDEPQSTDILDLLQTLHNEIIIKDEIVIDMP